MTEENHPPIIPSLKNKRDHEYPEQRFSRSSKAPKILLFFFLFLMISTAIAYFFKDELLLQKNVHQELTALCKEFKCKPLRADGYKFISLGTHRLLKQNNRYIIYSDLIHSAPRSIKWPALEVQLFSKNGSIIHQQTITAPEYLQHRNEFRHEFIAEKRLSLRIDIGELMQTPWGYSLDLAE